MTVELQLFCCHSSGMLAHVVYAIAVRPSVCASIHHVIFYENSWITQAMLPNSTVTLGLYAKV